MNIISTKLLSISRYDDDYKDQDLGLSDFEEDTLLQSNRPQVGSGQGIDKLLGVRYIVFDLANTEVGKEAAEEMQLLVKWKKYSYHHVTWESKTKLEQSYGISATSRIRRYVQQNGHKLIHAPRIMYSSNAANNIPLQNKSSEYFNSDYLEIDRILDVRQQKDGMNTKDSSANQAKIAPETQYLIKWKHCSYQECTWEWHDFVVSSSDGNDLKIAQFYRYNHPPPHSHLTKKKHQHLMTSTRDYRPPTSEWAKYSTSPVYANGNALRDYQLDGLNWMVFNWYHRRNCILADEMGLGKTCQSLAMLSHLFQNSIRGPFLIVAPLATLGHWKSEIEKWTSMNCLVYHDSEGGLESRQMMQQYEFYYSKNQSTLASHVPHEQPMFKFHVLITSYHIVMADAEDVFDNIQWKYVVIDEAHKLKNAQAKLWQTMRTHIHLDACLLLTGTPLQNGVDEIWSLLHYIEPVAFPNQEQFYRSFGTLQTAEQVANLQKELSPYMLRRIKEDVEKSIPAKEETIIDVELTTLQKQYYRAILERNRSFFGRFSTTKHGKSTTSSANLVNIDMELRKCCNHPFLLSGVEERECAVDGDRMSEVIAASGKTILLSKMLAKFHSSSDAFPSQPQHKILIFSQFKIMLDILEDMMNFSHYSYERLDGSVRGNDRQAAIDRFNSTTSSSFVFLLSTRAGGVGINLTSANIVILFDSDWNPQNDLQAVARCHRIGQTRAVQIYRLVTNNTYEQQMFSMASKKLGVHHAVFEHGNVLRNTSFESAPNAHPNGGAKWMDLFELDRDKIEMMIRYGAYAIMEAREPSEKASSSTLNDDDIDQILSSGRKIQYNDDPDPHAKQTAATNDTKNILSFSKVKYISATSDSSIDFHDDKFWEKVLGPKPIQKLMSKMEAGYLKTASFEELKQFLIQVREIAFTTIMTNSNTEMIHDSTHSVQEHVKQMQDLVSLLVELQVIGPVIEDEVNVKELATGWLDQIEHSGKHQTKRRKRRSTTASDTTAWTMMYHSFLDGERLINERKTPKVKKQKSQSIYLEMDDADFMDDIEIYEDDEEQKPGKKKTQKTRKQKKTSMNLRLGDADFNDDDDDDFVQEPILKAKKLKKILKTRKNSKSGIKIHCIRVNVEPCGNDPPIAQYHIKHMESKINTKIDQKLKKLGSCQPKRHKVLTAAGTVPKNDKNTENQNRLGNGTSMTIV